VNFVSIGNSERQFGRNLRLQFALATRDAGGGEPDARGYTAGASAC